VPIGRLRSDADDTIQSARDRAPGLRIEVRTSGSGALCRQLLDYLPEWFGSRKPSHVVKADRTTAVVALADGLEIGLLTLVKHTEFAAEIDVMAVNRAINVKGSVGR
jgi:hypothetical protein